MTKNEIGIGIETMTGGRAGEEEAEAGTAAGGAGDGTAGQATRTETGRRGDASVNTVVVSYGASTKTSAASSRMITIVRTR